MRINGKVLPSDCYTVREGSTVVELTPEYLNKLELGEYTLEIVSTTGIASASFTVEQEKEIDFPWIWLAVGCVMLLLLGLVGVLRYQNRLLTQRMQRELAAIQSASSNAVQRKSATPTKQSVTEGQKKAEAVAQAPTAETAAGSKSLSDLMIA